MGEQVCQMAQDGTAIFWCEGCETYHGVWTRTPNPVTGATWSFNGDLVRPTFSPSILVRASERIPQCHSFIRDGQIEYLSDCTHPLAGQTVPLLSDDEVRRRGDAGTLFRTSKTSSPTASGGNSGGVR